MIYKIYRTISDDLTYCFNIGTIGPLSELELEKLRWLIAETFEPEKTGFELHSNSGAERIREIGSRLSIESPFSSNAVQIVKSMNLRDVNRIERNNIFSVNERQTDEYIMKNYLDKMTEQYYPDGITDFNTGVIPEDVKIIDVLERGKIAIEEINKSLGLSMDKNDIDYYYDIFKNRMKRNPTDVELFQIGNANSEHSRHWFFKGKIVIDGVPMEKTLFQLIQEPFKRLPENNRTLKAFNDNAGVLRGFEGVDMLLPINPGSPSEMALMKKIVHITCTAETHNHPTGVSPYGGAATGTGGEIRDDDADGEGSFARYGVAGYATSNLFLPGYNIPGEVIGMGKLSKYAQAHEILVVGSDGATDYNNRIGRPLIGGFVLTFEQIVDREWRGYRKPILYSGGVGSIFDEHLMKEKPEVGMHIVRIGGPAYPIGVGGGSASSMQHGENTEDLDFNSVQRGNPEMENRVNRVIKTCAEMGLNNPISSIHDQGAGGPSNVLTELLEPAGGTINIRNIVLGDKTMPVLKIWSAEFQEGYGVLIRPERLETFKQICERERVNCEILGTIDGKGKVVVVDPKKGTTPVNLDLGDILTNIPQKTFETNRKIKSLPSLDLSGVTIRSAIEDTLKRPSVGSKEFLTNKADRSVGGLVAQQQCCGIEQIPISDMAISALSYSNLYGNVSSLGVQAIGMLINSMSGSRMCLGELLTNMVSAKVTSIEDIRCRLNWMWPAKLPYEGALLYEAALAISNLMVELGMMGLTIAADGGKDSASMASEVCGELVKAPGTLVALGYAPMSDITKHITPDIKKPGASVLALIDIGKGKNRLGGSALAQALNQLGNECPDVDDPKLLLNAFKAVQQMIEENVVLSIHDRSDGGLFTTVAEMCVASRCGFRIGLQHSKKNHIPFLFNEELGIVLELGDYEYSTRVLEICKEFNVPIMLIGTTLKEEKCSIFGNGELWSSTIYELRHLWAETSSQVEKTQKNPVCAEEEHKRHKDVLPSIDKHPSYVVPITFVPRVTPFEIMNAHNKPRAAVIREEGTNGDREMIAAHFFAGFEVSDVNMEDLLKGKTTLEKFQMTIFAGGFANMDVFGSAKGWGGGIIFNEKLNKMFNDYYIRPDTLSLGVCNGCQLMAILGWVPFKGLEIKKQPRFIDNISRKFESRWVQVEIPESPAIMLSGMKGLKLGVWNAHAEGRYHYPDESIHQKIKEQKLVALSYLDPNGNRTESYPYNPNGSPEGIAGLCSPDGRHLAMMPHPERCFLPWQMPWMPESWKKLEASPWLRMFQNARDWCDENKI